MEPKPQDVSERYELVERIAVGGMAEVFRAKKYGSHGFAKQMAVKRILPSLAADDEFVTRFIAEAKIAVTLSHANIVQVFDFSRFADSLYIAMEFVEGADLAEILARIRSGGGHMEVAPALHVAMELLKGLDFAHRKQVIHRDISPSNILLSRAGEVKIADFGIARAAGLEVTRQQRVMGKWPYMSPEQAGGDNLTVATDLFSAGTVLFELLTGERLFRGKNAEEIAGAIAERPIPRPSSIRDTLPTGLDEPLLALLERNPAKRPAAGQVLATLVEVSYQSTVQATAASLADEVNRLVPRVSAKAEEKDSSARIIDDIINSELGVGRDSVAEVSRVTHASTPVGSDSSDVTAMTFIKTSTGSEGLSEWAVGDATGVFKFNRSELGFDTATGGQAQQSAATESDLGRHTLLDAAGALRQGTPAEPIAMAAQPAGADAITEPLMRKPVVIAVVTAALLGTAAIAILSRGAPTEAERTTANLPATAADAAASLEDAPAPQVDADVADEIEIHSAELRVTSDPDGAVIEVDGATVSETTPALIEIAPRAQTVRIAKLGYVGCEQLVDASADGDSGPRTVHCALEALAATLTVISTPPGATVTLDGERLGSTPLSEISIMTPRRESRLVLSKSGYRKRSERISLVGGERKVLERRLEQEAQSGVVDIFTEPWANVYLRGKKIGVAPARGLKLPAGTHRLTLVNPVQKRRTTLRVKIPGKRRYKLKLPPAK